MLLQLSFLRPVLWAAKKAAGGGHFIKHGFITNLFIHSSHTNCRSIMGPPLQFHWEQLSVSKTKKTYSSWWFQPNWKIYIVKLDHFPWGENKKSLKPPPRYFSSANELQNFQVCWKDTWSRWKQFGSPSAHQRSEAPVPFGEGIPCKSHTIQNINKSYKGRFETFFHSLMGLD